MMAAAVLRYGPKWLRTVLTEMTTWLEKKEYESIEQLKGSMSMQNYDDASVYHRGNYMKAVKSYMNNLL